MSLRLKLILVLLIALVLPVAVSQWHLLDNFNAVQRSSQLDHLQKSVDVAFGTLQGIENDAMFNARLMATSGELDRYLKRSQYRLPELTTYRALLKSWSVFLKHYANYQQIGYIEKSGTAQVQFSLISGMRDFDLRQDSQFQQAVARKLDQFVWYRAALQPNTLSIFVAYGVAPFNAGNVVRRSNQEFPGYIVIRVDIDSLLLSSVDAGAEDDHVTELLLQDRIAVTNVATGANVTKTGTPSLQVERSVTPELLLRCHMPLNRIGMLDSVVLKAGLFSLLQFAIAAIILFFIVNRWLVQPLQHVLTLTRQLGDGHWLEANEFVRHDEMGDLIQSMHTMSDRLHTTSQELERKRQQAELAERLKTEFLANLSHEIRTPINIIVGVLNRLGRFVIDPRQKDYLASATTEAHKLVRQIDELILLADLETKKEILHESEFFIPDLIQHVTAPFLPALQQKQLLFNAHIDTNLNEYVCGDSQKISKVLDVLLDNAVKFTAQGEIELAVRLVQQQDQYLVCEFAVQDSGCGIDPASMSRLGNAFAQGDGSLQRQHGGLGLGLSIARGFLQMMGSELVIQSMPDQGTRTAFTLRLSRSVHAQAARSSI